MTDRPVRTPAPPRRSFPGVVAVLALVLVLAGVLWPGGDEEVVPGAGGTAAVAARSSDTLVIPSIRLDAPIDPIEVDPAGVLTPPDDVERVGWWQRSAEPGARRGQTVITGHTVHTGGGVMNRLGRLERGAEVQVHDEGRVVRYEVVRVRTLSVAELSEQAPALFGQDRRDGRLVLITCEDWVDGVYQSNIVVTARKVVGDATAA